MENYFTLNGKIEENRRFLRETQDKYEKIRGYYPLFFIYIGFIGFYTFDILQYFLRTEVSSTQLFLGVLLFGHILVFGYVFYLMINIFSQKDIRIDPNPKLVYGEYDKYVDKIDKNDEKNLENLVLSTYLKTLEEDIIINHNILVEKKSKLGRLINTIFISFIIYICLITFYKIKMAEEKPNEKKIAITDIVIIPPIQSINDGLIIDDSILIIEDKTKKGMRSLSQVIKDSLEKKKDNNIDRIKTKMGIEKKE